MAINSNWPRWIFTSITKHIGANLPASLPMFVEGQERDTQSTTQFCEVRMDGPNITELDGNLFDLHMEVNCLVQGLLPLVNVSLPQDLAGQLTVILGQDIDVYRYGVQDGDDSVQLGCFVPVYDYRGRSQRDNVAVFHFGQIRPDVKIWQFAVEVHYSMFLAGT